MKQKLSEHQQAALAYLKEHGSANAGDIAKALRKERAAARCLLDNLTKRGLVKKRRSFGVVHSVQTGEDRRHTSRISVYALPECCPKCKDHDR